MSTLLGDFFNSWSSEDDPLESMFLLAFFGFLRCSEFTTPSIKFNPLLHPTVSDLRYISEDCLTFVLKRSKTNQAGNPVPVMYFKLNNYLSPYEPLAHHIQIRNSQNTSTFDLLFITESSQVATRSWFDSKFRKVLTLSGISPSLFSSHSLCIGAASTASSQGVPDHMIKTMGR